MDDVQQINDIYNQINENTQDQPEQSDTDYDFVLRLLPFKTWARMEYPGVPLEDVARDVMYNHRDVEESNPPYVVSSSDDPSHERSMEGMDLIGNQPVNVLWRDALNVVDAEVYQGDDGNLYAKYSDNWF